MRVCQGPAGGPRRTKRPRRRGASWRTGALLGAVTAARSTARGRLSDEVGDAVDHLGAIEPRVVAGVEELQPGLAAQGVGQLRPELLADVRVARGPFEQRGAGQL